MDKTLNQLFYYLKKEGIYIPKSEFEFQLQSHPEYPSLLSLSDTLFFFNIDNIVINVSFNEIDNLPNIFNILLSDDDGESNFYSIERTKDKYYLVNFGKKRQISIFELKQKWRDIVLLVEGSKKNNYKIDKLNYLISIISLIVVLILFINIETNIYTKLFVLFPVVGLVLSIFTLKELLGVKNEIINKFCNISISTNCNDVINSSKWIFFRYVSFSDLSITFFASQIINFILFIFLKDTNSFLASQKFISFSSYLVIFISIYYQKYIEKKWCPICLGISSIIILESIYLCFNHFEISIFIVKPLIIFALLFILIYSIWMFSKKILILIKDLKEFKIKSLRFQRKYETFKKILKSEKKVDLPISPIILGNKHSNNKIVLISSPFCGYCNEVHEILNKVLEKNKDNIQVQIIFKANLLEDDENSKNLFRSLVNIYFEKGDKEFQNAIKSWYDIKNIEKWLEIYNSYIDNNFDNTLIHLYEWCIQNAYNFTPTIFINGYEYPKIYDRKELDYFINDLIDDTNF